MPLKSNLFRVSATASACGQRSVVHSLPQLVVVCSYCRWREEAVEMFDIVVYLVKQLIVGVFEPLIERTTAGLADKIDSACYGEETRRRVVGLLP